MLVEENFSNIQLSNIQTQKCFAVTLLSQNAARRSRNSPKSVGLDIHLSYSILKNQENYLTLNGFSGEANIVLTASFSSGWKKANWKMRISQKGSMQRNARSS